MKNKKTLHVISNSHWDREWGYPFEETRLLLLDFVDELLDLLDNDPDFQSFTFDSQMLALLDYLELRPENLDRVEKHVRSGRLIIGPWYSLPEEYLVNGESLVRNLIVGHRKASEFGAVSKIGYTPFSYGQTSQIAQIYNGFGIDTIIFYRGINTPKSEFLLEGPDGSRLLGMRFGCLSRFSYYFYIYRQVRYGMDRDDWFYRWDRGAAPFRMANDSRPREHYYILNDQKKQWNTDIIPEQIKQLIADESEHFTTSHIACMQGFDASNPDPKESDLIKLCQQAAPEHEIKLSNLSDYMNAMRAEIGELEPLTGESRDPGAVGKWTHLYGDVISARTRLKLANHRAELDIQRCAEPWSAIGAWTGGQYYRTALERAWILLLKNHPHDTLTGGGIDQMEKDSLFRADQINIISQGVMRRGMQQVQRQINNGDLTEKDSVLTVFNSTPFPRQGVISALVDMPAETGFEAFSICSPQGERKEMQVKSEFPFGTLIRNLQDISLELRSQRVHCHFETDAIPAFGYKTYHLVREQKNAFVPGSILQETNVLENENLRAKFNSDGTLDLTHKKSGHTFTGLHFLEDSGEAGHSWIHKKPDTNQIITSHGCASTISVEEAGPLLATIRIDYHMHIPVGIENAMNAQDRSEFRNDVRRSSVMRTLVVSSYFTLRKGAQRLDVTTKLNNTCRDHRLRVVFPTRLETDATHAEISYDVVARDIHVKEGNAYYGKENPTYPMHRFVDMTDGKIGLAVLNTGIREYEAMDTTDRPLAITLLRAFVYRNCPVIGRYEVHPEMELAQCPGELEWTYALYPHEGDWHNGVYQQAEDLNMPLEVAQAGAQPGTLPKEASFFELQGDNLQFSALKQAEDRPDSWIVRVFNPTDSPVNGNLTFMQEVKSAWLCNLNEERQHEVEVASHSIPLTIAKKKIETIEFVLKNK
ncbi:MAG: hypothetical protein H6696_02825 [Deferribacteres bacterium]|nr:hypothetical protein [candidate division KSB1 bacterium]MCB9500849.1 hypothetical protein [Deferribacteres bacterium]